jgi:general L-amino acid transport system permease protein
MAVTTQGERRQQTAFWRDQRLRSIFFQVAVAAGLAAFIAFIVHNTATNLEHRGLSTGFAFLSHPAGFDISVTLLPYNTTTSTYGRAYVIGLLNTLVVGAVCVVFATLWGFVLGVLRLSRNWLMARLAAIYVDGIRNIPLLLQLLFWYATLKSLPSLRQSLALGTGFFLNQRGLYSPAPVFGPGFSAIPIAFLVGIVATIAVSLWARGRQRRTGQQFHSFWVGLALIVGLPLLAAVATGFPVTFDYPVLKGFNFSGGQVMLPEFIALALALSLYTAAFIAEIVRAGILSVSHGQTEAASALGLRPGPTTRLIIIPQALRVIVPPLTSQYLNIVKNSSLAVAIGYPDLVNVFTGTVLNQTGKAVECVTITMLTYGAVSLLISLAMNWYNRRIVLVER